MLLFTEGRYTIAKRPMIGIVLSALHARFSAVILQFCGMTTRSTRGYKMRIFHSLGINPPEYTLCANSF